MKGEKRSFPLKLWKDFSLKDGDADLATIIMVSAFVTSEFIGLFPDPKFQLSR
jgi:hypothetical protein